MIEKVLKTLLWATVTAMLLCAVNGPAAERSGKWEALEKHTLADHPTCAGCGKPATTIHHVCPFHLFPEKELDPENLVAVCPDCHLHICHLDDFKAYNPLARQDLARHLAEVKARPYTKEAAKRFEHRFQRAP